MRPPPQGKQIDLFDAIMPGLVLRVNYGGAKVWRALYYIKREDEHGNRLTLPHTHKLGRFPVLNVKQAREAARKFLADPQQGLREADTATFKKVAEDFLQRHVAANALRWQAEVERCLTAYVYPTWKDRTFRDIRRSDVAALLDDIQDRVRASTKGGNGARQADIVLAIVRKIMHWYQSRHDDYTCPVVVGMKRSNGASARDRFLDDAEIRDLWTACADLGTYGALVQLLLLTGQRRDKVATMQWSDIDADAVWTIPTAKREKTNAGRLRLPALALSIINAQPRIGGNPYVFGGRGAGPFNSFTHRKGELDEKLKIAPWVIHDLRRSCRKLMTRARVRVDVAELALGHSIKGIQRVYDDRTEYAPMIDEALQCVADEVARIINPPAGSNVVTFERARP